MMQSPFNIVDLFIKAAKENPDKAAIICKDSQISFSELQESVNDTAIYFLSKGILKGDRVLIFVPMSIDLYRIILALLKIGATAVFLDEWVDKKRMQECCKNANCKAFIGIFKVRIFALFSKTLGQIPIQLGVSYKRNPKLSLSMPTTFPDDTALITFTTGSSGTPKAGSRTHAFLLEQFNSLIDTLKPLPHEIDMPAMPIVLLLNLGTGNTSIIADYKASRIHDLKPQKIVNQIIRYKINRIIASPFFLKEVSKFILSHNIVLPHIEKIFTGGGPVFSKEASLLKAAFPNAAVQIIYGSTEAEPISTISAEMLLSQKKPGIKGLNVGFPNKNIQLKIIKITKENIRVETKEGFQQIILPAYEVGEIIVCGPHVLNQYYNSEEALAKNKIFIDDQCWHRTGDSGYLDSNQSLFLTGRCDTIFYHHDKMILPFLFEGFFQNILGVEIGTVILHNKKLFAIIEPDGSQSKDAILQKINSLELKFDDIIFLKKIPRDKRHETKIEYGVISKFLESF